VLTAAAEQVAGEQLRHYFSTQPDLKSPEARLKSASALFNTFGFGSIDFGKVSCCGGRVTVKDSYFAKSWTNHAGKRQTPACHFTTGFIAGAISAAFLKNPGCFLVKERKCVAMGAKYCEFDVEVK
jgi:predicted hydrocarbon binding protein